MRRRWTCARWRRAGWSSPLLLVVLAGCGGGGDDAHRTTTTQRAEVRLPAVRPGEACPVSPQQQSARFGPILGDGPAYPSLTFQRDSVLEIRSPGSFDSHRWAGQKVLWVERPGAPAGLTVTGRRLDADGQIRFDEGDVPALTELELPAPDAQFWAERPGYTRIEHGGCYAYVVRGPRTAETVVFRAVEIGHWQRPGDRVNGRSAHQLERAIVEPAGGEENGLAAPSSATCRAASARERRSDSHSGSPWEFVCTITDSRGTYDYDVQVLPNWCYMASPQRHPGRFVIMACR